MSPEDKKLFSVYTLQHTFPQLFKSKKKKVFSLLLIKNREDKTGKTNFNPHPIYQMFWMKFSLKNQKDFFFFSLPAMALGCLFLTEKYTHSHTLI